MANEFTSLGGGTLDMDKIFSTGEAILNGTRSMFNACSDIYNGVDPGSRRNDPYANNQNAYVPPIQQYNYGYEERSGFNPYSNPYYRPTQSMNQGYFGFWNLNYGKGGGV
jgi:hypothetical protein